MDIRTIRKKSAFSLVELVACIAILAILASLTTSMMSSFHQRTQAVQSQSNLRQLAAANLLYAADHSGAFCPSEDPATGNVRWHGGRQSVSESFDVELGYLGEYMTAEITDCPLFKPTNESLGMGVGGYGYNAAYIGGRAGDPAIGANSGRIIEKAVMFTTTASKQSTGLGESAVCEPYYRVDSNGDTESTQLSSATVHFRVNSRALVAWTDGSVSALPPKNLIKNLPWGKDTDPMLGWFGPDQDNGLWNPNWIKQYLAKGGPQTWGERPYTTTDESESLLIAAILANQNLSQEDGSDSADIPTNSVFFD